MNKIRWGIIGPGIIAHQFARDIAFTSNAVITAVASNSAERAEKFASTYGIEKFYVGYDGLYKDPDVDAIYIATTHNFHLQNGIGATNAGKAVLCEKPLTDKLEDSLLLLKTAEEKGVYLMEGMWTYFLPTIQKAQDWLAEGRIGRVFNLKANFGYPKPYDPKSRLFNPDLSGGTLLDMGIYPVAMACLFMQMDPSQYNIVVEKAPTGVDYDVNMQLVYEDNLVANLHSSFKVKLNNHCYIFGEKGYIDIPDFWRSREVHLYEDEKLIDKFVDDRSGLGFEFQIEAASSDILNGRKESAIMPHSTSIRIHEHLQSIIKHIEEY